MSESEESNKSYDPTPKKLEDARRRGEVAKSVDLQTFAAYAGFTVCFFAFGTVLLQEASSVLIAFVEKPAEMAVIFFDGELVMAWFGALLFQSILVILPIFLIPAVFALISIILQRAFVFSPSKLKFKSSRVSILQNAKQKYGLVGLFEFAKSSAKLFIYSACFAFFLYHFLPEIVVSSNSEPKLVLLLLGDLFSWFLIVVVCVSCAIGIIDWIFQHGEHLRKNRMSRKEIMDELKESEGDPYLKEERRSRALSMASTQMMSEVPKADVIIVNPTHYAVALAWSREPGSAPRCIGKGVDLIALKIREVAVEAGVPIHSDPPTARALHGAVELGEEVGEEFYAAVAAAIRFADDLREKAKTRGFG